MRAKLNTSIPIIARILDNSVLYTEDTELKNIQNSVSAEFRKHPSPGKKVFLPNQGNCCCIYLV
jgi:hypothetical protein